MDGFLVEVALFTHGQVDTFLYEPCIELFECKYAIDDAGNLGPVQL